MDGPPASGHLRVPSEALALVLHPWLVPPAMGGRSWTPALHANVPAVSMCAVNLWVCGGAATLSPPVEVVCLCHCWSLNQGVLAA